VTALLFWPHANPFRPFLPALTLFATPYCCASSERRSCTLRCVAVPELLGASVIHQHRRQGCMCGLRPIWATRPYTRPIIRYALSTAAWKINIHE
jgi:hypothetical protein